MSTLFWMLVGLLLSHVGAIYLSPYWNLCMFFFLSLFLYPPLSLYLFIVSMPCMDPARVIPTKWFQQMWCGSWHSFYIPPCQGDGICKWVCLWGQCRCNTRRSRVPGTSWCNLVQRLDELMLKNVCTASFTKEPTQPTPGYHRSFAHEDLGPVLEHGEEAAFKCQVKDHAAYLVICQDKILSMWHVGYELETGLD